jgi:hypothetical protein
MIATELPRIRGVGGRIHLSCVRGHYLASIDRRDWAGSLVESMAGRPARCRECEAPPAPVPALPETPAVTAPEPRLNDRDVTIAAIRTALRRRTGQAWSVTGGRGTSWGWITVTAPPARRTEHGYLSDVDRAVLADALGLETVHSQGVSIPAGNDYRTEYVDRAEGRQPSRIGVPYWD